MIQYTRNLKLFTHSDDLYLCTLERFREFTFLIGALSTELKTKELQGSRPIGLWCIFRPTQIHYTSLLTYDKSAILHIQPSSTWFYTAAKWICGRERPRPPIASPARLLNVALGPQACPICTAWPRNCLNL